MKYKTTIGNTLLVLALLGVIFLAPFAKGQIETPEIVINDVQPLAIQSMGLEIDLVILTVEQWLDSFGDSEYENSGGMASWDGRTLFVRDTELWLIPHEVSHLWQMKWELDNSSVEPACLANPIAFIEPYLISRGTDQNYLCQKNEIWARYHGEIIWPKYCAVGSYWNQTYSLEPFGFPHAECLVNLDYAEHSYSDALEYFLGVGN